MNEVIQNKENLVILNKKLIKKLKLIKNKNLRKRSRICIHKSTKDKTNEMIIALKKKSFIQPHIHPNNKSDLIMLLKER